MPRPFWIEFWDGDGLYTGRLVSVDQDGWCRVFKERSRGWDTLVRPEAIQGDWTAEAVRKRLEGE